MPVKQATISFNLEAPEKFIIKGQDECLIDDKGSITAIFKHEKNLNGSDIGAQFSIGSVIDEINIKLAAAKASNQTICGTIELNIEDNGDHFFKFENIEDLERTAIPFIMSQLPRPSFNKKIEPSFKEITPSFKSSFLPMFLASLAGVAAAAVVADIVIKNRNRA